jgi:succinyl-CoA synthetase beta subunit
VETAVAAATLGGKAVIKGQVLASGRGKAGAIRAVSSVEEAESAAREILAMSIKEFPVKQILVAERLDIRAEYYAGITVDREVRSVVLIFSAAGGMDIEDIATKEPEKIRRFVISGVTEYVPGEALAEWLSELFPEQALLEQAVATVENMYRLFREKDCSLVEINPLAVTVQGNLVAADAKIVFDDNGVYRHPDVERLRNPEEYTVDELEAREAGLSFVSLSGQIGCLVNGAGLAMATMDVIKFAGGSAANFLDVGGSSNPMKVVDAMRVLMRNKELKVILVNIFGGITRCDDVAQGILTAREEQRIDVPIVIRLIGTNEEKGREMLHEAGLVTTREMTDAVHEAVECAGRGSL